jgi:hypothetical protein
VPSPILSIISKELQRPSDETVQRVYAGLVRLPKAQQKAAVQELIRVVVDLSQRPTHTATVVFTGKER